MNDQMIYHPKGCFWEGKGTLPTINKNQDKPGYLVILLMGTSNDKTTLGLFFFFFSKAKTKQTSLLNMLNTGPFLINCFGTVKLRRRQWQPTPVPLPGKSHGWRSLVGYSPWSPQESDTTERLHFHFSLSCIGEGNGNPLQWSCLENPRDGGAWWAAVYGVTQGRTRLKRLSSSSSTVKLNYLIWI